MPITPRATPTPIPTDAPVDKPEGPDEASAEESWAEEVDEDSEAVDEPVVSGAEVASLMFHPTTAIAPTVESERSVVVAVVQSDGSAADVDAKVRVMPELTSDRQSPTAEPGVPLAR